MQKALVAIRQPPDRGGLVSANLVSRYNVGRGDRLRGGDRSDRTRGGGRAVAVRPNQAFAWNPSIAGTRSEDTIIATETGGAVLTVTESWPVIVPPAGEHVVPRPDILVRG